MRIPYDTPIDRLTLSARALTALARLGVRTVGELADIRADVILALAGVGPTTYAELRAVADRVSRSPNGAAVNVDEITPVTHPSPPLVHSLIQNKFDELRVRTQHTEIDDPLPELLNDVTCVLQTPLQTALEEWALPLELLEVYAATIW